MQHFIKIDYTIESNAVEFDTQMLISKTSRIILLSILFQFFVWQHAALKELDQIVTSFQLNYTHILHKRDIKMTAIPSKTHEIKTVSNRWKKKWNEHEIQSDTHAITHNFLFNLFLFDGTKKVQFRKKL